MTKLCKYICRYSTLTFLFIQIICYFAFSQEDSQINLNPEREEFKKVIYHVPKTSLLLNTSMSTVKLTNAGLGKCPYHPCATGK